MRPNFSQSISNVVFQPLCPPSSMASGHNSVPPVGDIFYNNQFSPCARRQTPVFVPPEFKIFEINKRLQQHTDESDNMWWDSFASEFFEDDATLTISFCLEDGPKKYTIGRTLIPRYFRSLFENGVTDMSINLKHSKESFHNTSVTLDCDQCTLLTCHGKPNMNKFPQGTDLQIVREHIQINKDNSVMVCTEGRLTVEFICDELMRIKSWHFATRHHRELVPKGLIAYQTQQDPSLVEQLSKNVTQQGFTNATLNYLRLCAILEPMQELMSRHKSFGLDLRDCLKTMLFQKWQRIVAPPDNQRQPNKRRKRKSSVSNNTNTGRGGKNRNTNIMSPGPPNFMLASKDVMVVGEPSLMGGEFGDEDERLITRLENTQYDPSAAGVPNGMEDGDDCSSQGAPSVSSSSVNRQNANSITGSSGSWPRTSVHSNSNSGYEANNDRGRTNSNSWTPGSQEDKKPPS